MSAPGDLFGRYRLDSQLGQGGMGSVWRATHVELGTPAAVKLIESSGDPRDLVARFKREAQAAARLRGANVVQIFDFGVEDGIPYIAMELLEGESLQDRLDREHKLEPRVAAEVLQAVARAMDHAHAEGIIHRDLKPDNIFLSRERAGEVIKVLDFGIAKVNDGPFGEATAGRTKTGALLGTPWYMSPEQVGGKPGIDYRTDIWTYGVIAYECLLGTKPFNGDTVGGLLLNICVEPLPVPSQVGSVPRGFDNWFARVADRDVNSRVPSILEASRLLADVCGLAPGRSSLGSVAEFETASTERPKAAQASGEQTDHAGGASGQAKGPAIQHLASDSQLPRGAHTSHATLAVAAHSLTGSTANQAPPSSVTLTPGLKKLPVLGIAIGAVALLGVGAVAIALAVRAPAVGAEDPLGEASSAASAVTTASASTEPASDGPGITPVANPENGPDSDGSANTPAKPAPKLAAARMPPVAAHPAPGKTAKGETAKSPEKAPEKAPAAKPAPAATPTSVNSDPGF